MTKKILEGIATREDLYSSPDEINTGDKYDDSVAYPATTPLPFSARCFHIDLRLVSLVTTATFLRDSKGTQNYYTHLFRTKNGGGGVYGNLTINDEPPKVSRCHNHF